MPQIHRSARHLQPFDLLGDAITGQAYIYLLFNPAGEVVRFLNPGNERLAINIGELRERKSLSYFYDLTELLALKPKAYSSVGQKVNFRWNPLSVEFHSSLPMSALHARRIDAKTFLGRISFNNFMPNVISRNTTGIILVESQRDLLLGFSGGFYARFQARYGSPERMFRQPLENFLSPTPGEFKKRALPAFDPAEAGAFSVSMAHDLTRGLPGEGLEVSPAGSCEKSPAGLRLFNRKGTGAALTLLQPVDTRARDFILTARVIPLRGTAPHFILGERDTPGPGGLDFHGYLAGRSAQGDGLVVKKQTLAAGTSPDPGSPPGELLLKFCKVGNALFLFENGRRLIAHHDGDFLHRQDAFLSLGVRLDGACLVKSLALETAPAVSPAGPLRHVARLSAEQSEYFTLDPFYNFVLSTGGFDHVAGYFLNNVTEMQDRIFQLDRRYQSEVATGKKLRTLLKKIEGDGGGFVGSCGKTVALKEKADTVAQSDITVLIQGPTGSGKEVLAQYLHQKSARKAGPFVKVDCSTIPGPLMESHLFGHEKGAFTGAVSRNTGMFEKAHGGTLLLDEAANIPKDVQAKLLQFFSDFSFTRLGGDHPLQLDVRCIIASNVDLEAYARTGEFRPDLLFRINGVTLHVPPLKERIEDLPELCAHYLDFFSAHTGKPVRDISPEALKKLSTYDWPGNVREFKHVIQRAIVFCKSETLTPDLIQFSGDAFTPPAPEPAARKPRPPFSLGLTDRTVIESLLQKHAGRVTYAARELNVSRVTLFRHLKRLEISARSFRRGFE